jgi:beta-lactamase regulating signal transducer with metallopeptidase domain
MSRWAGALGRASFEGGLLILAVWALCRLAPRLPAALRASLWWLACLRLVVGLTSLAGIAPLPLPLLPVEPAAAPAPIVVPSGVAAVLPAILSAVPAVSPVSPAASASGKPAVAWPSPLGVFGGVLGALWLLAVLAQLVLLSRQLRQLRGILLRSTVVTDGWIAGLWERLCREQGVVNARLLLSSEVATPQAMGLLRPRVVLPQAGLDRLSPGELAMILCHELAHLRRRDLWFGWVPAVAGRLFFFHPLAVLAAREYALAREAACDAEVLAVLGEAPQAYGRLLLRLGISPLPRAGGLASSAAALATAAPSRQQLKRRLEMLAQASRTHHGHRGQPGWWCLLGLVALFALVPFRIVAAQEASRALRLAGTPPQPPRPPRAPVAPRAPRPPHAESGEEYVLLSANGSSTMNGSTADIGRAKKLLGPGEKEILWFRHGGKEYVVRDPQTLKAAFALFAPQAELGSRQAELGSRQAELGSRQAALGAEQAKLGAKQARLGAEQARVASDEARETTDGREVNNRLARQQDELSGQQDALGRQQDELGKQQDELGKQQDELGKQQDELGRQQDKLAREAEEKFKVLVSDAISRGIAREVGH